MPAATMNDDEFREEAKRRGYVLHSVQFSQAAQNALREIPAIRARLDRLEADLKQEGA